MRDENAVREIIPRPAEARGRRDPGPRRPALPRMVQKTVCSAAQESARSAYNCFGPANESRFTVASRSSG